MVNEEHNRVGGFNIGSCWSMSSKLCSSCKSAKALLYCKADSAYLCINCDSNIHSANKLASRHERVWMCEVCESAPASVTCKADSASLCVTCDRDIHSANPLSRRHERFPVVPFYESAISASVNKFNSTATAAASINFLVVPDDNLLKPNNEQEVEENDEVPEDDETEAASWLLQNPNNPNKLIMEAPDLIMKSVGVGGGREGDYFFTDVDPYLDLDYSEISDKFQNHNHQNGSGSDSVVPVQTEPFPTPLFNQSSDQNHCMDFDLSKPSYSYNTQSLSQSVSSSSMDVGVVPDANCNSMADISNPFVRNLKNGIIIDHLNNGNVNNGIIDTTTTTTTNGNQNQVVSQLSGLDREARVLRYREKRKNRKFEKTIRYASRKAYAETRPRIKGRFAKRTEIEADVDRIYSSTTTHPSFMVDSGYGIVPSF